MVSRDRADCSIAHHHVAVNEVNLISNPFSTRLLLYSILHTDDECLMLMTFAHFASPSIHDSIELGMLLSDVISLSLQFPLTRRPE